jgi:hypothetical protein
MTRLLVAPNPDMISGTIEGLHYDFRKHDLFGRVVDAHEAHIPAFRMLGFRTPDEIAPSSPVELSSGTPVVDLTKEIEAATASSSGEAIPAPGADAPATSAPAEADAAPEALSGASKKKGK